MRLTIKSLAYGGDAVARAEDGRAVFVHGACPGDTVDRRSRGRPRPIPEGVGVRGPRPVARARHAAVPVVRGVRRLPVAARLLRGAGRRQAPGGRRRTRQDRPRLRLRARRGRPRARARTATATRPSSRSCGGRRGAASATWRRAATTSSPSRSACMLPASQRKAPKALAGVAALPRRRLHGARSRGSRSASRTTVPTSRSTSGARPAPSPGSWRQVVHERGGRHHRHPGAAQGPSRRATGRARRGALRPRLLARAARRVRVLRLGAVVLPGEHRRGGAARRRSSSTSCSPGSKDRVLDLYAGVGTFTLPLAAEAGETVAVEAEGSAIRDLRRNLERARLRAVVVPGDVGTRAGGSRPLRRGRRRPAALGHEAGARCAIWWPSARAGSSTSRAIRRRSRATPPCCGTRATRSCASRPSTCSRRRTTSRRSRSSRAPERGRPSRPAPGRGLADPSAQTSRPTSGKSVTSTS